MARTASATAIPMPASALGERDLELEMLAEGFFPLGEAELTVA
jgi:hypothetical protein